MQQIDFAKNVNELWKKTIVYELRIKGGISSSSPRLVTATLRSVADQGTMIVHGHTLDMTSITAESQPGIHDGDSWFSKGELETEGACDSLARRSIRSTARSSLVRAAYEALPFESAAGDGLRGALSGVGAVGGGRSACFFLHRRDCLSGLSAESYHERACPEDLDFVLVERHTPAI